jgi:hypothetical protein
VRRITATLFACAAPALCAAQAPPPGDLGAILAFTDPARCTMGAPLRRIQSSLRTIDPRTAAPAAGPPVAVPGRSEPLRPRIRRHYVVARDAMGWLAEAEIELRGIWLGLAVVGLRGNPYDEGIMIRFAEPPERVRTVLAGAGFRLRAVGHWRHPDYGKPDPGPTTSVLPEEEGAVFYCAAPPL